jgi:hypothetical protein
VFTIKLHSAIAHLSETHLEELMAEYYDRDKTVKSILEKYNIKAQPSQLVSFFPPLILEEKCEYCHQPLAKKRDSRTGYSSSHPFCLIL